MVYQDHIFKSLIFRIFLVYMHIHLYREEIWIKSLIIDQSAYVTKNKKTNDEYEWTIQLCAYIPCKEWVKSFEIYVKFPPAIYVQQSSCNIFTAADSLIIKADDQNWTYQHGIMKNDTSCPTENIIFTFLCCWIYFLK